MSGTPLLIKPSLEEVKLLAAKVGLPDDEAELFFLHYQSNGWKVGKVPMKCWKSALQGWRIRWQQRQSVRSRQPNGADRMIIQKEFERCVARMKAISDGYAEHQSWTAKDRAEYTRLKERKAELMRKLDIII